MTTQHYDIVFDGPPAHVSGRFVETENDQGASISIGTWVEREDGLWALRIPAQQTIYTVLAERAEGPPFVLAFRDLDDLCDRLVDEFGESDRQYRYTPDDRGVDGLIQTLLEDDSSTQITWDSHTL